jgi:hypothetical protein
MGLAGGCTLLRDIKRDEVLTRADVSVPAGRICDELRAQQDALFEVGPPIDRPASAKAERLVPARVPVR